MADGRTDGRTNVTARSATWSCTAWDDEIPLLKDKVNWPIFVAGVAGGLEKCPKSGRIHYQAAVFLNNTQRFAALKKWLPKAHWEPARNRKELLDYCMKKETAVAEKEVIGSMPPDRTFLRTDQVLTRIADEAVKQYNLYLVSAVYPVDIREWLCYYFTDPTSDDPGPAIDDYRFIPLTRAIVRADKQFVNFIDNKVKQLWIQYREEFIPDAMVRAQTVSITRLGIRAETDSSEKIEDLDVE